MGSRRNVVVVDPGSIIKHENSYYIEERSYLGYISYFNYLKKNHPDINFKVVAANGVETRFGRPDSLREFESSDFPVDERPLSIYINNLDGEAEETVILALCSPNLFYLSDKKFRDRLKTVYLIENNLFNKLVMNSITTDRWVDRLRNSLWLLKDEFFIRRSLRRSQGVQFNGVMAERSYSRLSSNTIKFFDHRVDDVRLEKNYTEKFSIGISGRLIKIKGSQYIPGLSKLLYKMDSKIGIYLMGDGGDRDFVVKNSAPNLYYKGFMSYKEQWEPFVEKNIDLMVFLHLQGDPSMTYFETLGRGVPLIGYSNTTLDYLVEQGCGWSVPKGDVVGLARKIYWASQNRDEVKKASECAVTFMSENLYAKNVSLRMEHLVSLFSDDKYQLTGKEI